MVSRLGEGFGDHIAEANFRNSIQQGSVSVAVYWASVIIANFRKRHLDPHEKN
jgi:hypothetical protein